MTYRRYRLTSTIPAQHTNTLVITRGLHQVSTVCIKRLWNFDTLGIKGIFLMFFVYCG